VMVFLREQIVYIFHRYELRNARYTLIFMCNLNPLSFITFSFMEGLPFILLFSPKVRKTRGDYGCFLIEFI